MYKKTSSALNKRLKKGPEALYDFYFRTEAETFVLYEFENQFYVPEVEILKVNILFFQNNKNYKSLHLNTFYL